MIGLEGEFVVSVRIIRHSPFGKVEVSSSASSFPFAPGAISAGLVTLTLELSESTLYTLNGLFPLLAISKEPLTFVPALTLPKEKVLSEATGTDAISLCSLVMDEKSSLVIAYIPILDFPAPSSGLGSATTASVPAASTAGSAEGRTTAL